MKRIITIGLLCIFLFSFISCKSYGNVTFGENNSELLYQGDKYYETPIFDVFKPTEYSGVKFENDIELGLYYSFPFSTMFYSNTSENPAFIYTIGGKTSMYLKQDYDYSTDVFVVENTDAEIVWEDIFIGEKSDVSPSALIRVYLYSKQYPRIRTYFDLTYVENQWYIFLPNSKNAWIASDGFIDILFENGIL